MFEQTIYNKFLRTSKLAKVRSHEDLDQLGLYFGQPPLLFILWKDDGLSRRELADKLCSQPATITKMIRRLENNGFVESRPDATDSRVSRVYLTEKGRAIEQDVVGVFRSMEEKTFKGFSKEDMEQFEKYLNLIEKNIKNS